MKYFITKIIYFLATLGLFSNAFSAGFYLTQLATPGSVGTAGVANVTNTRSADSAWTNPAAMTALDDEYTLGTGVQIIFPKMEFNSSIAQAGGSDGGNAGEIAPIPSFFLTCLQTS